MSSAFHGSSGGSLVLDPLLFVLHTMLLYKDWLQIQIQELFLNWQYIIYVPFPVPSLVQYEKVTMSVMFISNAAWLSQSS